MEITTRLFGKIDLDDNKIIEFPGGIVGFPDLKKFALIHDSEKSDGSGLGFLQSLDEPAFDMPVMNPLIVKPDYNPMIEDELLKPLGELKPSETVILVTVTVPHDLKKMTVNLMAPFIINAETRKGAQIILNDDTCDIRFPIYDILTKAKEGADGKAVQ